MADLVSTSYTANQANQHIQGAGLYSIADENVQLNVFGQSINFKYPKAFNKGPINIHNDFCWSNSTKDKTEVPVIFATEYELTWGQTVTNLQRVWEGAKQLASQQALDPYLTMYSAKKTGFNYAFPHLIKPGSSVNGGQISNQWSPKNEFNLSDALLPNLSKIGGSVKNFLDSVTTGFGFEETSKFGNTTSRKITIEFPLYNTKDLASAFQNYCFCLLFGFQNLKTRTSFMTYIPPKLYNISNPYGGGIYIPVAVVSEYKVDSIGTTRRLFDHWQDGFTDSSILIPEAYKVSITFQELVPQSSNIMLGTMGGDKVSVMNNDVGQAGNEALQFGTKVFTTAKEYWFPTTP